MINDASDVFGLYSILDKRIIDLTTDDWLILNKFLSREQLSRISMFNNYELLPDINYIFIKYLCLILGYGLAFAFIANFFRYFGNEIMFTDFIMILVFTLLTSVPLILSGHFISHWLKTPAARVKTYNNRVRFMKSYQNFSRKYLYNKPVGGEYDQIPEHIRVRDIIGITF